MVMYRYMTFLWNRSDHKAHRAVDYITSKLFERSPHTWRKAWEAPGITVYDSGEQKGRMHTRRLAEDGGVLLGQLFRNDFKSVTESLDLTTSTTCLKTKGQYLIDNYWGRYVAFLNDRNNSTRYIIRDPSGAFPCFHTSFQNVEIYFSDMQDVANFDFLPFTVNWDYLRTHIMLPMFQKTHTGLKEVSEVLPAERVEITPFERKSAFIWNPTKISQADIIEATGEAVALLHDKVEKTIGALAGCYDRIVHNLGGLDSSIMLACLAKAETRPDITAINFFTKSPRGEERFYSRQVAEKYNIPLVEIELDYRKVDISKVSQSNKLVNPLGMFDCIGLTGDLLTLAKEQSAQALFYGVGGDNVFFQMPYNLGALDYTRRHGVFNKNFLRVTVEASRYGRKSLAKTLRDALREHISPAHCYDYVYGLIYEDRETPLINSEFIGKKDQKMFLHPLLIPKDQDLKGKYLHTLCSAFFSIEHYDHWDTEYYAERTHPYLTQPIVETCLRIPIWIMTLGGIDRGLARKAFQHDLPQDIVRRLSKGTPGEYYKDIYQHNVHHIRETLLDGLLVKEKILLRDKLEKALYNKDLFLRFTPYVILNYFGIEAWLRDWMERPTNSRDFEMAV